jgi:hypothetical protein
MIRRETQTAKTIRDSFHDLLLMDSQQEWQVTKMFIYDGEADGWWRKRGTNFYIHLLYAKQCCELSMVSSFLLVVVIFF